jgi:cation transport ATPase
MNIGLVNVQNTPGHGLQAQIDGLQWAIGRPVWVAELFELGTVFIQFTGRIWQLDCFGQSARLGGVFLFGRHFKT